MADALIGITETAAAGQATIANIIQSYLVQESKILGTVSDFSRFVVPGSKSVSIPRSGGFTVGDKAENTAVDAQVITYAADALTLSSHKVVQFLVEEMAETQMVPDMIADAVSKASRDLALAVDTALIAEIADASTSAPDHSLVFIDTTGDVMALADILAAKALLEAQNIEFNECYIGVGPEKMNELLAIASFIQAERWGNSDPIQKGVIGSIYGAKVLMHTGFSDQAMFWHPSAVGIAFDRQLALQSQRDLANLGTRYSLDLRFGASELDSGKRQVFIDSTN